MITKGGQLSQRYICVLEDEAMLMRSTRCIMYLHSELSSPKLSREGGKEDSPKTSQGGVACSLQGADANHSEHRICS